MRRMVTLLLAILMLALTLGFTCATALATSTQPALDPSAKNDAKVTPKPTEQPVNASSVKWRHVGYYLTEKGMGGASAVPGKIKSIIKDYGLGKGTHHLRSTLKGAYPDESAKLVITDTTATLTGPYFSKTYTVNLK